MDTGNGDFNQLEQSEKAAEHLVKTKQAVDIEEARRIIAEQQAAYKKSDLRIFFKNMYLAREAFPDMFGEQYYNNSDVRISMATSGFVAKIKKSK